MEFVLWLCVVFAAVPYGNCDLSTLTINVVHVMNLGNHTFTCSISPESSFVRWYYLRGPAGTVTLTFQNGTCTASPTDSFLSDRYTDSFLSNIYKYSYTCNSTAYQVTLHYFDSVDRNNILACRDGLQPIGSGSTWIIKSPCDTCVTRTMSFTVKEITEGHNITFVCIVSSDVSFVNWNKNLRLTAPMAVQNRQCDTTTGTSFLDNTSAYIYTCNNTVYQVTKLNVQRSEHNDMYMCTTQSQSEGQGSNWIIRVKAPAKSASMTPADYEIKVIENTAVEFTCTTSTARPAASVYWYIHPNGNSNNITLITENITTNNDYNELSVITSTLRFVLARQHNNTKIVCSANNSVNTSPVMSNMKLLNILYKTDGPYVIQGNEYRVIENNLGTLSCSVKGGNPTPSLSWSCNNLSPTNQSTVKSDGNITTTLRWTASRNHSGTCICTSEQNNFQKERINVSFVVLYPPSKPVLKVNGGNVVGDISFIQGTTRSFECTSDSKPPPDRYTWTDPSITDYLNTQTLTFNTIEKYNAGRYKCSVYNIMNPSSGDSVVGINTIDVNVVVLYPPVVAIINNISILQGEDLNVSCPYTAGIPNYTSIKWTRNIDDNQWHGEQLRVLSVNKNETGYYTCDASNVMRPSGDNTSYIGNHSKSFYMNVLYKAVVLWLLINGYQVEVLTVDEGSTITFKCVADGNPVPAMTLSHDLNALMSTTSRQLDYTLSNVSCQDIGTYSCAAQNELNIYMHVTSANVIVHCSPKLSETSEKEILSGIGMKVKIACEVIAYPLPSFTWWYYINDQWKIIQNTEHVSITSSGLHTIFIIEKVGTVDFTSYKVIVENSVGNMEQVYLLNDGSPDTPTQLRYFEDLSTSRSIKLAWNAGYNGGSPQIFYIKYKPTDESLWTYKTVTDDGEQTQIYTLNGLEDKMYYYVIVFASNEYGNSTESQLLIAKTKDKVVSTDYGMKEAQTSNIGPMVGGIVGGLIVLAVILTIVGFMMGRYMERKRKWKKSSSSDKFEREDDIPNVSSSDIQFDNIVRENEYEVINQDNSPSMPYSTLQHNDNMTPDDNSGEKKEEYENLKVQAM